MTASTLISEEMRTAIARNHAASEREARFAAFHFGGFVLIALVSLGALAVDYMIVNEFWTRALANEFLELPGALASSVAFKSMQVLFATVAAHILFEHMGRFGRAAFLRIVFVLALVMLLGVGFLLAVMSLPNGMAASGAGGAETALGSALAGLGLSNGAEEAAARNADGIEAARAWLPVFWLSSLGIVFLVVTGVAALCIHFAVAALRRVFLARDFRQRCRDMERLAALEAEYDANRHALAELEGPENRRHLLWTGLMREARAYEEGLEEARRADMSAPPPARRLIGRREPAPAHFMSDRLKSCEASRDIARYERLFDDWWERRSRNAMKAGPANMAAMREASGQILPAPRAPLRLAGE